MCVWCRQLDNPENHDIPAEILNAWKQAVVSKSRASKQAVFMAFLKAGKDWSRFLGWITCVFKMHIDTHHGMHKYRTFIDFNSLRLSIRHTKARTDRVIGSRRKGLDLMRDCLTP